MRLSRFALAAGMLCLMSLQTFAGGWGTRATTPSRDANQACLGTRCSGFARTSAGGMLRPVSGKAREIAGRLDIHGYDPYLSEAYKGYPELRSRTAGRAAAGWSRPDAVNRARFRAQLEQVAHSHRLDPALLDAVIIVESGYDPDAVSEKGALGLMQLMPETAKRFDVADPFDPLSNMSGGANYLRWLLDHFENDIELALAAYNAGEATLVRRGNEFPPYEETRVFVDRVLRLYRGPTSY